MIIYKLLTEMNDMLNELKRLNNIPLFTLDGDDFKAYGRVVRDIDASEIISTAEKIVLPETGSVYHASEPSLEALKAAGEIKNKLFGQSECQLGYCYGHNSLLNCLEWHTCNEINIAVTDAVLILAKLTDLDGDYKMNSSACKAFFVPKGSVIEVYSDTLHFCPCEVSREGFGMAVGLSRGTNTALDFKPEDKKLWARNKWLIAHKDNKPTIDKGAYAGIFGENYQIKY